MSHESTTTAQARAARKNSKLKPLTHALTMQDLVVYGHYNAATFQHMVATEGGSLDSTTADAPSHVRRIDAQRAHLLAAWKEHLRITHAPEAAGIAACEMPGCGARVLKTEPTGCIVCARERVRGAPVPRTCATCFCTSACISFVLCPAHALATYECASCEDIGTRADAWYPMSAPSAAGVIPAASKLAICCEACAKCTRCETLPASQEHVHAHACVACGDRLCASCAVHGGLCALCMMQADATRCARCREPARATDAESGACAYCSARLCGACARGAGVCDPCPLAPWTAESKPRVGFASEPAPPHNPAARTRKPRAAGSILKKPRAKRLAIDPALAHERPTVGIKSPRLHFATSPVAATPEDPARTGSESHDSEQPAPMEN